MDNFIEMRHITKSFPGVLALDNVNFDVRRGEIHAVVGQNGAGKSTLMKILSGVYQPDQGEIYIDGTPVKITDPHYAQQLGISTVYQELNLIPDMSVAENVFLGREPKGAFGLISAKTLEEQARNVLNRLGVDINPHIRLSRLKVAEQQIVEIAKALSLNARLIIMDEPSATLGEHELQNVFNVIGALKQQGIAVVYISHRLSEIFEIADRVTVFKDGKVVGTHDVANIDRPSLIRMMIGRTFSETFPAKGRDFGEEILSVAHLCCKGILDDVSFSVRRGEIVGLAGLIGAGKSEIAQIIFGTRKCDSGEIRVKGLVRQMRSPQEALECGIGFLTEDRKKEGLVIKLSVRHNTALPSLEHRQVRGFVKVSQEEKIVSRMIKELAIHTPGIDQEVQYLSGGNQQKVVLSKWLIRKPDVLIFDEPTRGIDVGAKSEIWNLMRELANRGTAILMISSELPEILGMSDRIIVIRNGKVAGILDGNSASEEQIMMLATYGGDHGIN